MENTPNTEIATAPDRNVRPRLLKASTVLSRITIVTAFILIAAGNITNSLLMKYGFEDQAAHASKHATFIEMMNGTAAQPFVYRSVPARLDYWTATGLVHKWPWVASVAEELLLHRYYFADVKDADWTPEISTAYTLMYFVIVASTALGLFFVWRIARFRGLSYAQALAFTCAFSFIFPLFFQRSALFYDFIEFAGVFGACYFFLEDWMIPCTLVIVFSSFVKETFFLVPIGLFFLHKIETPMKKRLAWFVLQLGACLLTRYFIMQGFKNNLGGPVEFHLFDSIAFWLRPKYYLDLNNLVGPGILLPRLENPLILIPIALFGWHAWRLSDGRWRRYFLAAYLPLLALFIPFGFADMFRNFSLAFPAIALIALSSAGKLDSILRIKLTSPSIVKFPTRKIGDTKEGERTQKVALLPHRT